MPGLMTDPGPLLCFTVTLCSPLFKALLTLVCGHCLFPPPLVVYEFIMVETKSDSFSVLIASPGSDLVAAW